METMTLPRKHANFTTIISIKLSGMILNLETMILLLPRMQNQELHGCNK